MSAPRALAATLVTITAAASVASADTLVASHRDRRLAVDRVTRTGITRLYELDEDFPEAYAFTADGTLWVVRGGRNHDGVDRIVDGKVVGTRSIALADFKLEREPDVPGIDRSYGLLTTRGGQVWATRCVRRRRTGCDTVYVRVDDDSLTYSAKPPPGIVFVFGDTRLGLPRPLARSPAGYAAKLVTRNIDGRTIHGFVCQGPGDRRLEWPSGPDFFDSSLGRAVRATWVSAKPPILHVEIHIDVPDNNVAGLDASYDLFEVSCELERNAAHPLADQMWLIDREVFAPDGYVGAIEGDDPVAAP